MARFDPSPKVNPLWDRSERGRRITVVGEGFIRPDTKFFAMGSCFAVEIRQALRNRGLNVAPDYPSIAFDPATQMPGKLPLRDNVNHYDTFAIAQEIARALDRRRWTAEDFWEVGRFRFSKQKGWPRAFQDPQRRHIFATSRDGIVDLSDKISACIDAGLEACDVVILTLGLTEVWRIKATGLYAALGPENEQDEIFPRLQFRATGYQENYDNLRATLMRIWAAYPDKKIVLTVSPVSLTRTWTDEDVVRANLQSKSTLRAVAGQIVRDFPAVTYWPSYEFAMTGDVFREDGQHVRPDAVDEIVAAFLKTHSA
ncbi:MAG: GSCFA domain-containing protein [Alphaproteobacteria bacterium]|nr:GSCFA domain-containing protein [Alphaproteobacteria bacterium]